MPSLPGGVHNFRMIGIHDVFGVVRLRAGVRRCATLVLGLVLVAVQLCTLCGMATAAAAEADSPDLASCHQGAGPKDHSPPPQGCDCPHAIPLMVKAVDPVAAPFLEETSPDLQVPVPGGRYRMGTFAEWQPRPPGAVAPAHFPPELDYRVLLI